MAKITQMETKTSTEVVTLEIDENQQPVRKPATTA